MKKRKQENLKFAVKWIVGNYMFERWYKRDHAAVKFQQFLIEEEGIKPEDVRIVMK